MEAVIYVRQSQDRSGDEMGVTRQRDDAYRLAALRGWRVVAVHVDNDTSASGRSTRPGFNAALADLESGAAGVVIAWDLTRLTRNARDRLRLLDVGRRRGVIVALVRGSDMDLGAPSGRLTADILASVAEHEIDVKSDRQRRAAAQAAAQGRRIGGRRPFGYEQDGMTLREHEAEALRAAYVDVLAGASIAAVARWWNAAGLRTPQARRDGTESQWMPQSVRAVLLNPRNAGLRSHVTAAVRERQPNARRARLEGIVGPAAWPPIVDEVTWRAAVAALTDPGRTAKPRSGRALLTGLALCGVCGATVHAGASPSRRGRPGWRTYRCSAAYGHLGRSAEPVESFVQAVMVERLTRSDATDLLFVNDGPDTEALRARATELRRRRRAVLDLVGDGTFGVAEARELIAGIDDGIAGVEAEMVDAGRVDVLGGLVLATDVRTVWERLDLHRRRAVIALLMTVRLLPPGRGTRTFRPETVAIEWRS